MSNLQGQPSCTFTFTSTFITLQGHIINNPLTRIRKSTINEIEF